MRSSLNPCNYVIIVVFLFCSSLVLAVAGETEEQRTNVAIKSLLIDITTVGQHLIAVGERGLILRSSPQFTSWSVIPSPTSNTLTSVFFSNANTGWAVGHEGIILQTVNGGLSWQQNYKHSNYQAPLLDVYFLDEKHGYVVGAYGLLLTTDDSGVTWNDHSNQLQNEAARHLNAMALYEDELYIVGESGLVFKQQGNDWLKIESPAQNSLFGGVTFSGALLVYGIGSEVFQYKNQQWKTIDLSKRFNLFAAKALNTRLLLSGSGGALIDLQLVAGEPVVKAIRYNENGHAIVGLEFQYGQMIAVGKAGVTFLD